jgi:hypothetical protein
MPPVRRWLLSALTAVFLLALVLWPVRILVLESDHGPPVLLAVDTDEKLVLQYTHSIYHVRQQEIYEMDKNELVLRSMYFGDMSAALYYDSYARYPLEPEPGGGYKIDGMDVRFPAVSFALGHGTQYEIRVGTKRSIDLRKTFADAAGLVVRTEVVSRGEYLVRRLINGNR